MNNELSDSDIDIALDKFDDLSELSDLDDLTNSQNVQIVGTIQDNNNEECKIFVGNVPYNCIQEEFDECFKDVTGFIKAEIITVYKTHMSRGFGFVTMKTLQDAEILKQRDDIILKGRILRFTSYHNDIPNENI